MKIKKRSLLIYAELAIFLAVTAAAVTQYAKERGEGSDNEAYAAEAEAAETPEAVLLLTYPKVEVLKNIERLVDEKLLSAPRLHVVGLFQEADESQFIETKKYARRAKLDWFEWKKISCEVGPDDVFKNNACTDMFGALFDVSHGAVFSGGPDLPPSYYREEALLTTRVTEPNRSRFETSFMRHLIAGDDALVKKRPEYVVLGLCLGMQTMNVALGGTLVQDIPTEIYKARTVEQVVKLAPETRHTSYRHLLDAAAHPRHWRAHPIVPADDAWLADLAGGKHPKVVSAHHQSVDKIGSGLEVAAWSADKKVVEAVRHGSYANVLGIQFHAEYRQIWKDDDSAKNAPDQAFHRAFWSDFSARLTEAAVLSVAEAQ